MTEDSIIHRLKVIPANINDSILIKVQKTSFWNIIGNSGPTFDPNGKIWEYCKGSANFLYCVIWTCLAMSTKINSMNL